MVAQGAADPVLSVALVTRNRLESLARTLDSLGRERHLIDEIIVSDDSDEPHAADVRTLCDARGCTYVRGPRRGLYANRNFSIRSASGTHVRTMDDDHEFPDGHFAACHRALESAPGCVWVVNEVIPGYSDSRWVPPPQLHPRGYSATPPPGTSMWSIADGATIYPRWIFAHGEEFAEDFPFGASYLEMGSRLYWLGVQIRHLGDTYVIHHYDPRTRSYADERTERAARYFAMVCHSWLYQPTVRNKALTLAEIAWEALRAPSATAPAVMRAVAAAHRRARS
jgi:glycosyltransferase involved in cell wall biosynthesis